MAAPSVLVVDPDPHLANWLGQVLAGAGFEARVAVEPGAAQAHMTSAPIQLIVVNALLPGSGGPGFVGFLRDQRPNEALAALHLVPADRVTSALASNCDGLDDFIVLPPHPPTLIERARVLVTRVRDLRDVVMRLGKLTTAVPIAHAKRMKVTIMFTDVRSFTQLSETRDPETVAGALNDLFEDLATCVLRYGGTIDKFMGDGMMAIFIPDQRRPLHALSAVRAAHDIMIATNNSEVTSLLTGTDFRLGIGLHSGPVVMGPIGPRFARDMTAIGDTVNTAARLCGAAQPGELVVSQSTYNGVEDDVIVVDARQIKLKGKRKPQQIYAVRLRT